MRRVGAALVPVSFDFALLLLRVWFGLLLFIKHGLEKAMNFSQLSHRFADPFHIGPAPSLLLVLLAEVLCSLLVVLGFQTRIAAAIVVVNLSVAFGFAHHFQLFGQRNGELAFAYLGAFLVVCIAGPGAWSIDAHRRR